MNERSDRHKQLPRTPRFVLFGIALWLTMANLALLSVLTMPAPTFSPTHTQQPATLTASPSPTPTALTSTPQPATHTPSLPPTEIATSQPATSTVFATPWATATDRPEWLSAPDLIAPEDGASFTGWSDRVTLEWSSLGPLDPDLYYVVRIPYDAAGGTYEFWRKDTSLEVPAHFSLREVGFSDRHYNWSVQVMRCLENCSEVYDDNIRKTGRPAGNRSAERLFYWFPGQPSSEPSPTRPWPTQTALPPPPL